MSGPSVEQWCSHELTTMLGEEAPDDIVRYLLDMDEEEELVAYLHDLVGANNAGTAAFVKTLLNRRHHNDEAPVSVKVYKKPEEEVLQSVRPKQRPKSQAQKAVSKKVDLARLHKLTPKPYEASIPAELPLQNGRTTAPTKKASPKRTNKTKFVSLYSAEGEAQSTIQLAGRHCCECQAHKHKLVANCLTCGRVVCAQEGSGPCLFCGQLVCTKAESEMLARNSKTSEKLRKKLMEGRGNVLPEKIGRHCQVETTWEEPMDESMRKAIEHKNRLLENDRSSLGRLVTDDQSDYFATDSNHWLSDKERAILQDRKEELIEHKYGSRRDKKVTLDFAGRRVIEEGEEQTNLYDINDEAVQAVHYGKGRAEDEFRPGQDGPAGGLVNPDITRAAPQFSLLSPENVGLRLGTADIREKKRAPVRIQDGELLKMSDEGWCLSMHQPWASLLIEGIKKHEGRTWYSAHRGRLWIAAGAKRPTEEEIQAVEQSHRLISGNEHVRFPSQYPTGCLLGCVDMVDCLAQEQYREKFPDGESNSEYVFIVESPQELILRFPVKGRHKLWRLESQIHKAAKKGLRRPEDH